ncbi:hypothetical protein Trydic_g16755 [Trypoxylus dichotomus]
MDEEYKHEERTNIRNAFLANGCSYEIINRAKNSHNKPKTREEQHSLLTGYSIDFDNTKILAKSGNLTTRIIREAIEIEKNSKSLNKRDDTQRVPHTWNPLLTEQPNKTRTNRDELRSLHIPMHQAHNTQTSEPIT